MTDAQIKKLLERAIAEWGSKRALAQAAGISENHLHRLLADPRKNADARRIDALNLVRVLEVLAPGRDYPAALLREAGLIA